MHSNPSHLAGKTVKIKSTASHPQVSDFGGSEYRVEDYWDRLMDKSWMHCYGNPACLIYAVRGVSNNLPHDDEVLYGKVGRFGHLVHVSEIDVTEYN